MLLEGSEALVANPPPDAYESWEVIPDEPELYDLNDLVIARVLTWMSVTITVFVTLTSLRLIVRRRGNAVILTSLYLAIPLGLAPSVIRLFLPWENPWTGAGSPMFVCMTVPFFAVLFGVPIALPAWHFILAVQPDSSGDAEPAPSRTELSLPTPLDQR